MWALNKGDWPWLLLGLLGAVVAGGTTPSEGVFLAQVQVRGTKNKPRCIRCMSHSLALFASQAPNANTQFFSIGSFLVRARSPLYNSFSLVLPARCSFDMYRCFCVSSLTTRVELQKRQTRGETRKIMKDRLW